MRSQRSPSPAETYEQYLGPAIADPWTRVLLGYAARLPREREWMSQYRKRGPARRTDGRNEPKVVALM